MEKNLETDAQAEPPGAVGGSKQRKQGAAGGTETRIEYKGPDGSHFTVLTSGNPPNMQVGHNNVMHVTDKALYMSKGPRQKPQREPKLPLLKSTDVPGGDAMDIVARHIGRDWKALGRRLGLTDGELDNVKIDYYIEGQYEVIYQMIRKWKELAYPTELKTLAKACAKIGRGDVADMLAQRYAEDK